jgi:hypothetical protein
LTVPVRLCSLVNLGLHNVQGTVVAGEEDKNMDYILVNRLV